MSSINPFNILPAVSYPIPLTIRIESRYHRLTVAVDLNRGHISPIGGVDVLPILLRQHRSPSAGGLRKGADGEQRDHHAQRKNKAENALFHKSTSSFSEILSFCYQYNTF